MPKLYDANYNFKTHDHPAEKWIWIVCQYDPDIEEERIQAVWTRVREIFTELRNGRNDEQAHIN